LEAVFIDKASKKQELQILMRSFLPMKGKRNQEPFIGKLSSRFQGLLERKREILERRTGRKGSN
jgi:hypothetical protein